VRVTRRALQVESEHEVTGDVQLAVKPYLIDLESTNGSFINGTRCDRRRVYCAATIIV
jgi:pSer/pThr/pTyr-binding forkhead associated (FHA) protein